MKSTKRLSALFLCLLMAASLLAGCGKTAAPAETNTASAAPQASASAAPSTLVVGCSKFSGKFSPFFASTASDMDASDLVQAYLLQGDREGGVVLKGIEGEKRAYNGTDYTYKGLADCDVVQNADGTVDYNIKLRDDVVFSDGEPMTIDDVIFSMYVFSDPTYDGSVSFYSLPIEGMEAYRTGMSSLGALIHDAGENNTDYKYFTAEQQQTYWDSYHNEAVDAFAQEIVDYCKANYSAKLPEVGNNDVALGMYMWGYGTLEDNGSLTDPIGNNYDLKTTFPTIKDYAENLVAAYDGDYDKMAAVESAGSDLATLNLAVLPAEYSAAVLTGGSAASITGIRKTGDYTMTLHMTEYSAAAIYQLEMAVAPLHYYGDKTQYDYENNKFGFPKGDLSSVRSATAKPLGAGAYVFQSYKDGVITYAANEKYYKGAPKTDTIQLRECADEDKLAGVVSGTLDISDPSFSAETVEAVKSSNSNGELTGDVLSTSTVDNLGYGYIGMNADNVSVGGAAGSDASKDLRKGLATLFAVYRDAVIESYYGERAAVINYPISNTSWAAPKPADEGYQTAYSTDADGKAIYTSGMTDTEKYAAALAAAVGYFKAAGYTWDGAAEKFTAAPAGASLSYQLIIPGGGTGSNPSYGIVTAAKEALASIGFTLEISDAADTDILWAAVNSGKAELWAAAWQAAVDPDMTQIYYSANAVGAGGTDSNKYCISDKELDKLIDEARASADQTSRKTAYKQCLDIVLDWACEVPVYQCQNAVIFSSRRVNLDTLTPDITTFWNWMHDIELLEMK